MERKNLIKVLEILEKADVPVSTKEISDKLGWEFHANSDLLQILNYLIDSNKVEPIIKNSIPIWINGAETIKIKHSGIDLLTELKTLEQKEKDSKKQDRINESIKWATVVMAIASVFTFAAQLIATGQVISEVDKFTKACFLIFFIGSVFFLTKFLSKVLKHAE